MKDPAEEQYLNDFIIKKIAQNEQFNQWLRRFFYLNSELSKKHDVFHQELFYVRLDGFFTECFEYANKELSYLKKNPVNAGLQNFYSKLVSEITNLKLNLTEDEYLYIGYRRNVVCHILQNGYEIIQDDFKIKKKREGMNMNILRNKLKGFILLHGGESNIDKHLNSKIQPKLISIHTNLVKLYTHD